jgi:hypothetical protein
MTINATPGAITGMANLCAGSTAIYSDTSAGSWSVAGSTITIDATGNATTTTAGTDTLVFTAWSGCFVTYPVTVNPLPAAISGMTNICRTHTTTLTDTAFGGIWNAGNTHATINAASGVVTGNSAGTDTMLYTLPTGCASTFVLIVNEIPEPINGLPDICPGMHDSLTCTGAGVWLATNANGIIDSTTGVLTGVVPGNDTVVYTLPGNCSVSAVITIDTLPTVGAISGSDTLCNGMTTTLSDAIAGGSWSSGSAGISLSAGVVTGLAAGIDTVIYTVSNVCGSAIASKVIVVADLPGIGPIAGGSHVCTGATLTLMDAAGGGSWAVNNTTIATITPDGIVSGLQSGTDTVRYTVTAYCGMRDTFTVVGIDTLQTAHVSGSNFVCPGHTDTLYALPTGGIWSLTNGSVSLSGNVATGLNPGIDTVTYQFTGVCGVSTVALQVLVPTATICDSINAVRTVAGETDGLLVYPNPAHMEFHVQWTSMQQYSAQLRIYNINGQQVATAEIKSNQEIESGVLHLPSGIYIITVTTADATLVRRLVIME